MEAQQLLLASIYTRSKDRGFYTLWDINIEGFIQHFVDGGFVQIAARPREKGRYAILFHKDRKVLCAVDIYNGNYPGSEDKINCVNIYFEVTGTLQFRMDNMGGSQHEFEPGFTNMNLNWQPDMGDPLLFDDFVSLVEVRNKLSFSSQWRSHNVLENFLGCRDFESTRTVIENIKDEEIREFLLAFRQRMNLLKLEEFMNKEFP